MMSNSDIINSEVKETGRLEAFSDGIFAIAITLLILEVRVPHLAEGENQGLMTALLKLWPVYTAYVISFLTISVAWVNHHHMFKHIQRVDNPLLFFNSLLLMVITFLNFTTALLAEYIGHPEQKTAALVYTGTVVVISILFNLVWLYASSNNRLLGNTVDLAMVKSITTQYRLGPFVNLIAFVLAFVNVPISLAVAFLLVVFYSLTGSRN